MPLTTVRIRYSERGEAELSAGTDVRDALQRVGEDVARDAAASAPKETGRGAASIHAETTLTPRGWEARVSWDPRHYYLYFHEKGWENHPARPFLRPAAERRRSIR